MKAGAIWTTGLSGLAVLSAVALFRTLPLMESELKSSVQLALAAQGMADVTADVSGQDVKLTVPAGTVDAKSRLDKARSVVATLQYSDPFPLPAKVRQLAWLNAPVRRITLGDVESTPSSGTPVVAQIVPDLHHSALPSSISLGSNSGPVGLIGGEKATSIASEGVSPRVAGDSASDASALVAVTCEAQVEQIVGHRKVSYIQGTYDLTPESQTLMDDVYKVVAACPAKVRVTVSGYTDNVGDGTVNQLISLSRAQAAADALVDRGLSPDRVAVRGFGATAPVADNTSLEGREKNRRVVFGINAG